jgi:hypothetical protein
MKEETVTLEDLFRKHNGVIIKMGGHKYKVKYTEYKTKYPSPGKAVFLDLEPTAQEKKTEWYLKERRKLGDDWSVDAKNLSDDHYVEVYKQLVAKK